MLSDNALLHRHALRNQLSDADETLAVVHQQCFRNRAVRCVTIFLKAQDQLIDIKCILNIQPNF